MNGSDKAGLGLLARESGDEGEGHKGATHLRPSLIALSALLVVAAGSFFLWHLDIWRHPAQPTPSVLAKVTVSAPLVRELAPQMKFLGQFSATDRVELRAQVGGTLSQILFKDGEIAHKGDLLFVIDTRPYEIKLRQATSTLQSAKARLELSNVELWRAQQLKKTSFGTAEAVDQRQAEQDAAAASVGSAAQAVLDAQLDLEFCHVTAPFTGRMSNHLVSVGNLVSGSRAGSSPTTLLTTIVSLDPIYIDFDMSENDFITYQSELGNHASGGGQVALHLGGEKRIYRGTLDFIDNAVNRSSGTIHARATVANQDLSLVPGEFAEIELTAGMPTTALLIPSSAVVLDQSDHLVMTVASDGTVVPKQVQLGGRFGGLQIIRDGLAPTDEVIIDGLMHAQPGTRVVPEVGSFAPTPSAGVATAG